MKQFYEAYSGNPKVSPLVTQIQWSNHLIILSGTKTIEEKEFYLQVSAREKYSKRELERQVQNGLFERSLLSKPKVSPVATQIHPNILNILRDSYSLDFLGLPDNHSEYDLRKGIVRSLFPSVRGDRP
jgi:predicted nuclease of restriction endonuclease-like (RecB) superfamily